eukprot:CAMPEP_0198422716 /NCGR_PEP_ID=MMETSP1452-20131203/2582_1 /TAXON_ID=1181717 /ORGANISM="Synchroma pusillum, Strain CCMP3072" /LENGTH=57 /DNA_ID=CAMNT_0044142991 /DNA_START=85 /DNA_END=255 /DNA_ORIENTATION=-
MSAVVAVAAAASSRKAREGEGACTWGVGPEGLDRGAEMGRVALQRRALLVVGQAHGG